MKFKLRRWLALLLVAMLPFQGVMAAAAICCNTARPLAAPGPAAVAAPAAHEAHDAAGPHDGCAHGLHASHADMQADPHTAPSSQADPGAMPGHLPCPVCAAFCAAMPLPAAGGPSVAAVAVAFDWSLPAFARPASAVPDGIERPPPRR